MVRPEDDDEHRTETQRLLQRDTNDADALDAGAAQEPSRPDGACSALCLSLLSRLVRRLVRLTQLSPPWPCVLLFLSVPEPAQPLVPVDGPLCHW